MTILEGVVIFVTGGTMAKLIDVWLGRRRAAAEVDHLEAQTGHEVVAAAGEVIQHYRTLVDQLTKDVAYMKGELARLQAELDEERSLRLILAENLAALQNSEN